MKDTAALLIVSFGTSYPDTRERTIDAIESDLSDAFPQRRLYRAWTSSIIRKKLSAQGEIIDSVSEAMDRMAEDGIEDVLVQPTHLLVGEEYEKLLREVSEKRSHFAAVSVGAPLLATPEDVEALSRLMPDFCPADGGMTVWMGHGSDAIDLPVYDMLNDILARNGHEDHAVGTVEFAPGFEAVLERVRLRRPEKITLAPLMVVAGDHATNDMAGPEPDSWRSRLEAEGFTVDCVLKGLGEYEEIRAAYVARAKAAEQRLS